MLKNVGMRNRSVLFVSFIIAVVLVVIVLPITSNVETWHKAIDSLDKRKTEVLKISISSAAASAVISALPNDTATPVADELAQLGGSLIIVSTILYTEIYLLPVIGAICPVILAISCIAFGLSSKNQISRIRRLSLQFGILAICTFFLIPSSLFISTSVDNTFDTKKDWILSSAVAWGDALNEADFSSEERETDEFLDVENKGFFSSTWGTVSDFFSNTVADITEFIQKSSKSAQGLLRMAKTALGVYIEAIALLFVSNCVVPILVLFIYAKIIKFLFKQSYQIKTLASSVVKTKRSTVNRILETIRKEH